MTESDKIELYSRIVNNYGAENRPHLNEYRAMKKEREESPLGKGLPAPLCLWRCFWFPASNCGLEMVGALISHR